MQFHGEYPYHMDPQGRVAIPARYRDAFKAGVYLTKGFDRCVWIFPFSEWEAYSSEYAGLSPELRRARTLRRKVFSSTFDVEMDRQGRVLVPQPLREYASLKDEVVIAGFGNLLELWDRGLWAAEMPAIEAAGSDAEGAEDDGDVAS